MSKTATYAVPRRGKRFGNLFFVRVATHEENHSADRGSTRGRQHWLMECGQCGKLVFRSVYHVIQEHLTSCGCGQGRHFLGKKRPEVSAALTKSLDAMASVRLARLAARELEETDVAPRRATPDEIGSRSRGAHLMVGCKLCGKERLLRGQQYQRGARCPCVSGPMKGVRKDRRGLRVANLVAVCIIRWDYCGSLNPDLVAELESLATAAKIQRPNGSWPDVTPTKWKPKNQNGLTYWLCMCDCGTLKPYPAWVLRPSTNGKCPVKSCGCLRSANASKNAERLKATGQLFKRSARQVHDQWVNGRPKQNAHIEAFLADKLHIPPRDLLPLCRKRFREEKITKSRLRTILYHMRKRLKGRRQRLHAHNG